MQRALCAVKSIVLVGVMAGSAAAQATIGGDWRADVDRFGRRLVESGATPGMSIAVSQGDWVLHTRGFGIADLDSGRRVDDDTLFYIASSTKALTATAATLLAHRGALDPKAPITRYLPQLRFKPPLEANTVTVHDLLAMTHGIEDGGPVVLRTAFTGDFTEERLVDLLAGYGPSPRGRVFNYGNLGYNILGLVLQSVTEGSWKEVVHREVLEPLGMRATTAYRSRVDSSRMAMPHEPGPSGAIERVELAKQDANLHAAGGHFATANDIARFLAVHATGGLLEGRRVLPAAPLQRTHEKHAEQDRKFGPLQRYGWGYGWDLGTYEGKTVVHRFGGFTGYRAHASFMPDHGIGVAVLVNSPSPMAELMATYIYDRLLGRADLEATYDTRLAEMKAEIGGYLKKHVAHLAERRARLAPLAHPPGHYAGIYEHAAMGRMEWREVAGGLEMRMGLLHSRAEMMNAAEHKLRVDLMGGGVAQFVFPIGGGPATHLTVAGQDFRRVAP